jgi:hypothetical protein
MMLRDGQTIRWLSPVRPDTVAGVARIALFAARPLRYIVVGDARRIPLPVPVTPMRQDARSARVTLLGLPADAMVRRAFPRFEWMGDTAWAVLRDVPSFVRVPQEAGWGVGQWSEVLVVALVVLASLLWYRRTSVG